MQSKSGKIVRTSQTYCRSCSHHVHHDHHDHQVHNNHSHQVHQDHHDHHDHQFHNHHCHLVSSPLCTLSSPRSFAASNNNIGLSRHLFSYQTFSFFHVSHLCSPFRLLGHTLVNLLKGSRMLHFPSHPLNFHLRYCLFICTCDLWLASDHTNCPTFPLTSLFFVQFSSCLN